MSCFGSWILTGGRRLLDIFEFQIIRIGLADSTPEVLAATAAGQVTAEF
jgi:hypothetical protein